MKYFNSLQRVIVFISLVLVSFRTTAQETDILTIVVDKNGIAIAEECATSALLIKNEGDVPDYYLYTAADYIKPIFGKDRGNISQNIYLPDNKEYWGAYFEENKESIEPYSKNNENWRTIIECQKRLIGNAEGKDNCIFRIVDNINYKDKFFLNICRAKNKLSTLNECDSTLVNFGNEFSQNVQERAIVFTSNDKINIDSVIIKIPAYTFLNEVRVGNVIVESRDVIALTETDFRCEQSAAICLNTALIDSLYANAEMSIKYLSLDENGALNKESIVRCKVNYVQPSSFSNIVLEYFKAIKWWVYAIIGTTIVLIVAVILVLCKIRRREHNYTGDETVDNNDTSSNDTTPTDESAEISDIKNEPDQALQQVKILEAELNSAKEALATSNDKLESTEAKLSEVTDVLNSTKDELDAANQTISAQGDELANLKEELRSAKSQLQSIEEHYNEQISSINIAHDSELERLKESHAAEIEQLKCDYDEKLDAKDQMYDALEQKRSVLEQQWKSDRGQVIEFFQSQLYFIDKYLDIIREKADRSSPIYELLLQLSDTTYGYNIFRSRVIETLQNETCSVAEVVKEVRIFVEDNMNADMSWINNAARLFAYASTDELKVIFGHYNDAENDTRQLFDQIKILVAMWGITDIQIPQLFVTQFNDDEFAYDISNLVLPTLYPQCMDLQKGNMIFDFLRVGYVVNSNKVKPKVAY